MRMKSNSSFLLDRRSFGRLALGTAVVSSVKPLAALAAKAPCRLRIGVLSDIHVPTARDSQHFRKTLKWFDEKKADGVIVAGDLGCNGLIREMKVVADVWNEMFPGDRRTDGGHVEKLFVTGNHDVDGYFYHQKEFPKVRFPVDPETAKDAFVFNRRRVWKELFGEEYETVKMKEVKGYKFVLFQWYPRLAADVCSGREQSIWQGSFTSVETSACPGLAMAGAAGDGRANYTWADKDSPGTRFDCATPKVGQFMSVYDDRIVIENREFSTGEALTDPREFPWPISRGRPYAYETRRQAAVPPEFPVGTKLDRIDDERQITLSFPTVRRENAGQRAIDYEVTCIGRWAGFERIVDQRRVYSQGLALPESHDRSPVTVVYLRDDLAKSGARSFRFEVRPCDSWNKKGRVLEG